MDDSWELIYQDSTIFFKWENSKMFIITSKYFNIFNNKPPASWVAYYSSYYSSMLGYAIISSKTSCVNSGVHGESSM